MPRRNASFSAALVIEGEQVLDVGLCRRAAVGPRRVERDRRSSSRIASCSRGGTEKMRRRLGESPGALTSYGPLTVTMRQRRLVPRLRIRGTQRDSSRTLVAFDEGDPESCGPAVTESGTRKDDPGRLRPLAAAVAACPDARADRRELRAGAVDRISS